MKDEKRMAMRGATACPRRREDMSRGSGALPFGGTSVAHEGRGLMTDDRRRTTDN
ncbi:MAG: hypothetical protein JXQ75_20560 [Phycisphaerae bacterium]|nr:hypothetical protein [Phycisphaerae bacterium]